VGEGGGDGILSLGNLGSISSHIATWYTAPAMAIADLIASSSTMRSYVSRLVCQVCELYSVYRPRQSPCSVLLASMPPSRRHSCGRDQRAHGNDDPATAWPPRIADVGVVALCPQAQARGGGWIRSCRTCPHAYLFRQHDYHKDPSLRSRYSSRPSQVLRSPRTPAAQRPISHSAYSGRLAATTAA